MRKTVFAEESKRRRKYGEHLTPVEIFHKFILPDIIDKLTEYLWVDLFAGEGNLILPILNYVDISCRIDFFKQHIFMSDIQRDMIDKSIANAEGFGIPENIARQNIVQRDSIKEYPTFLIQRELPVFHITNPPYLYLGYISKNPDTQTLLDYFRDENSGYQDLYQICLMNDLRNKIGQMIYLIPTNFLFGFSSANLFRDDFLSFYTIKKAIIFEKAIFDFTGTNVGIFFFERKKRPSREAILFEAEKINKKTSKRSYILKPENHFRAGGGFDDFTRDYKVSRPIKSNFYLSSEEVNRNLGDADVEVIDVNNFNGNKYAKRLITVNQRLKEKIISNILFVRTVDTGTLGGRAGLYIIRDVFGVDGILVSKLRYRTHPIHIFFEPSLSKEDQVLLRDYVNLILEYYRRSEDSEFMTTYKYSNSSYTRKYLGLSQVKKLIETFPILSLDESQKNTLKKLVRAQDVGQLFDFLKKTNKESDTLWL